MEQSRSNSSRMELSRGGSRNKIFNNDKSVSSSGVIPVTYNQNINKSGMLSSATMIERKTNSTLDINQQSFFNNENQAILAYFEEGSRNYYKCMIPYAETGFDKISLDTSYKIPFRHKSIISNDGDVYLLGGELEYDGNCEISNKVFRIKKHNDRYLEEVTPMRVARMEHSAVWHMGKLYVFGGITSIKGNKNYSITNHCEVYDPR